MKFKVDILSRIDGTDSYLFRRNVKLPVSPQIGMKLRLSVGGPLLHFRVIDLNFRESPIPIVTAIAELEIDPARILPRIKSLAERDKSWMILREGRFVI